MRTAFFCGHDFSFLTFTVNGPAGNDRLDGGPGNDTLNGGTGNDTILGGDGSDTIVWNAGDGADLMESAAVTSFAGG